MRLVCRLVKGVGLGKGSTVVELGGLVIKTRDSSRDRVRLLTQVCTLILWYEFLSPTTMLIFFSLVVTRSAIMQHRHGLVHPH